jgi:murein DD-endopeptidase MepM/ murein hydrolase activator NlpD
MRIASAGKRCGAVILMAALLVMLPAAAQPPSPEQPWRWPVSGVRQVITPFQAPAHDYGPGHRGIDLAAPIGTVVHAPADGVVAFRGTVVDRPLITIDHGNGLVTTFEPMDSTLSPGTVVSVGEEIGTVSSGGHSPADQLHLGVRLNGVYINPMLMFGDVPRAVLLPCCAANTVMRAGGPVGRSL